MSDWKFGGLWSTPLSEAWTVTIAGPAPALNSSYHPVVVNGKLRLAKHSAVSVWQDAVAWQVKAARPRGWEPGPKIMVTIEWYSSRKRDSDAGVKACLDAVAVGLGVDDARFLHCVPVNEVDKVSPRTVIRLENMP